MKLLFVQIGDLHMHDTEISNDLKVEKLCAGLSSIGEVDEIFLVLCGDLSKTGGKAEFLAVRKFVNLLIRKIKKINSDKSIYFFLVPGNHDLNFEGAKRNAQDIKPLLMKQRDENYYLELKMLQNFFDYAKSKKCFVNSQTIDTTIIELKEFCIQVNLLNTAPFSSTDIDDKRLHHIPHIDFDKLKKQGNVDANIAIMHHGIEWFCEDTKRELRSSLFENCEIVLQGHEHDTTNDNVENALSQKLKTIQCGEFEISGTTAEFNAIVLDTEENAIEVHRFAWDNAEKMFTNISKPKTERIIKKCSQIKPCKEFLDDFTIGNHKVAESSCIMDYFVFPKLISREKEKKRQIQILSDDDFFAKLVGRRCVSIEGGPSIGKTTLMKSLFLSSIDRGYVPLFLVNKPSLNSRIDKLTKRLFEDQYGDDRYMFERFTQSDRAQKIVFIDDFDQIHHEKVRMKLLDYLLLNFEHVVISTNANITTDLLELAKKRIQKSDVFTLALQHMYKPTRSAVVTRICHAYNIENDEIDRIVSTVDKFVYQTPELFSLSPDFIVKFVKHYLAGGEMPDRNSSVFGAIFQSDITRALSDATKDLNVDIYLAALDEIAYYMHFSKKPIISGNDIEERIFSYNEAYSEKIDPKAFVDAMIRAEILIAEKSSLNNYRFKDKNVLSYFVARRMSKDFENNPKDFSDLSYVIRYICSGINGIVVLFLSFLRSSTELIDYFIHESEQLLENTPELNVDDVETALFLRTPFKYDDNRSLKEKREANDREIEEMEKIASSKNVKYKDIYDYDESKAETPNYRIGRAVKCLEIISKSLLALRGNLKAEKKKEIIKNIYTLPNRVLYKFFSPYNDCFHEFEESVGQLIREYYNKDVIPDGLAKSIILESSWSVILSLYDDIAFNCSDSNSILSLDEFELMNTNHRVQNLIMAENSEKTDVFIKRAIKLHDSNEDFLQKYLVRRVSEVHAIKRPGINRRNLDRMNSKLLKKDSKEMVLKKRISHQKERR